MKVDISKEELIQVIKNYGIHSQTIMLFEEMSELQKEICKLYRKRGTIDHVIEELADVVIMLEQLQLMLNLEEKKLQEIVDYKMDRLKERMESECNKK